MTDRITKVLSKMAAKERKKIEAVMDLVERGRLDGMDIKKLQGREDIYRVRKGDIRIIFLKTDFETHILAVERRTDTTY
jgi:mRNA-degrading endonuclease RelE of RelBE toxin-antitoxin system